MELLKPSPAASQMPKTVSARQLAANARNARKSTGPKTPQGRDVSKRNALKHGIFSKEVLVHGFYFQESSHEFTALFQDFRQSLNPVGPVEEMLVDQIVTAHWRLRRALRAESGEITLSVEKGQFERSKPNMHWRWMGWELTPDQVGAMEESAIGIDILASWLREIRDEVEEKGELTEAAVKLPCRGRPNLLSIELEDLRLELLKNPAGADPAGRREANKKQVLSFIHGKLAELACNRANCVRRELAEENARQAVAVLPAPEVLDKILRYETKLQRQLFRAMNHLERLQRMRQGEAVPPPLAMELPERS
jgi:ABC-type dipeptide/oligopeptide/nickel transport system ATPase subunit